ncbi:hypothetical protein BO82DRAFT_179077 [Aspergillus uvarum CBS 121591]|uniref:Uncharacterized protein n=1 Tax=Aspergillus uvarum CBS 121591 TaxID=1448315 RepID=A0A319BYY7_9EURO|nr:hypothetical protein BO82DRAFT_179077 [Aspergillus uvarum CBS 121591]PYH77421.1 hypothetical protein BO82DRAFT_179077 [Aspergillus uvarum CBS 121591]
MCMEWPLTAAESLLLERPTWQLKSAKQGIGHEAVRAAGRLSCEYACGHASDAASELSILSDKTRGGICMQCDRQRHLFRPLTSPPFPFAFGRLLFYFLFSSRFNHGLMCFMGVAYKGLHSWIGVDA